MREVLVQCWCDLCSHAEPPKRSEARTFLVAIGATRPREIDLCADHSLVLISPLQHALDEHGSLPADDKRPHRRTRPLGSPPQHSVQALAEQAASGHRRGQTASRERTFECLWCPLTYSGGSGLLRHLLIGHESPGGIRRAFGRDCPLCGEQFDSLSMHLTRTHDQPNITQAFLDAARQGDPFGAVERAHKGISVNVLTPFADLARRE